MWLSFRTFRRAPAITAVVLGSIAITVGATAVVFTAVKTVLLDPLPYANADELVQFRTESARGGDSRADWVTWPDMQDVRRRNHTFQSVATYHYALLNFSGDGNAPPEALYGLAVSANMFPTLGVKPMLGRNILPEETQLGRDREMILSYGLWTRRFNSDPSVIGRSVEANGHACTIIGVMEPGFDFPMRLATTVRTPSQHMDFWVPRRLSIPPRTLGSLPAWARSRAFAKASHQPRLRRIFNPLAPRSSANTRSPTKTARFMPFRSATALSAFRALVCRFYSPPP